MQNMQIKAEKQDSGYRVATEVQPSPALPSHNGGPPSHPSQLNNGYRHMPPQLYSAYGQVPGQFPPPNLQGGQPPYFPPPTTVSVSQMSQVTNGVSGEQDAEKLKVSENQIDFSSVKGIFGWTTVDGVNVPYIFRKDKQFVSVRIVEQKLLSKYPNSYPDELGKHQPLTSYFITVHEAKLLNEINSVHCGGEFGQKQFNSKDLIVLLEDFVDFYNLVKKTFPEAKQTESNANGSMVSSPLQSMQVNLKPSDDSNEPCGWIQVNNTVTPYVRRDEYGKFVPLSVMKYAAALSIPEKGVLPSEEECELLNKACKLAGFNFTFSMTTRIICLTDILKHCQVHIMELPMENPLQHAQYLDLPSSTSCTSPNSAGSPSTVISSISGQTQASTQPSPQSMRQDISELSVVSTDKQLTPEQATHYPPPGPYMAPPYPYMDPRYVFTYNRHPMYPVNYGPPNVTVNQPHPSFQPGSRPPYQNGHFPVGQQSSSYPSQDQMRPSHSPIRSPNANIPPSSMNNHVSPTAGRRPRIPLNNAPPNMYHPSQMNTRMRAPNMQQYNMAGRPRGSVGRPPYTPRGSSSSRMPDTSNMQGFPFVPNYPLPQMVPPNQQGQGMTMRAKTVNIPPPPNMSGPHQAPGQQASRMPLQGLPNGPQTAPPSGGQQINSDPKVNGVAGNTSVSLPQERNVSQNGQNQTKNKTTPPALVESIKGVWLAGKSISCMHLDRPGRQGKFCLVEAVCKLYFNGCSVNEFLYALENVLKVPLVTCTDEEEKSFIHYYSLPVSVLKCNKMINYNDLNEYFPQLSYVFREKTGSTSDSQSSQTSTSNKNPSKSISEDLSRKRPLNTNSGPASKQPCRRLEATVQRLMSQQESQTGEHPNYPKLNGESSGGAVIILD
ncbi:uncharacterized protein LOC133182196 isoform X1 [Saccostrea echinata]|uniref:uncharacterized protein LOC133182196 isoform X1 n=1 Tax=Saccostrea echinata TaxID=191078 RepID=UPI002A7F49BA|nr:uncharacterized protein LOC133182196 isoform X1 [Saccostrea echinata]